MFRQFTSVALPLSLLLSFLAIRPYHAATPITTFGVTATVQAGCRVSGAMFHGTFTAAVENAVSSVSISCTDTTLYSIAVIPETTLGATTPIGQLTFPLQSLMNYAIPSDTARDLKWNRMVGTGLAAGSPNGFFQPNFTAGESAGAPFIASNAHPDMIFVAITY